MPTLDISLAEAGRTFKGRRVSQRQPSRSLALTFLLLVAGPLLNSPLGAQGSGASFLKIPIGAKAMGLGSAFTAVSNDVSAIYWNPGGLARFKRREVGLMHTELYGEARLDFAGYVQPSTIGNFGVGATYLTHKKLQGRDDEGKPTADFSASDLALALSFSRRVGQAGLGANVKFIRQRIAEASASGLALDLGASYRALPRLQLGLSVLNLGPRMKFQSEGFQLPLAVTAGAGYALGRSVLVTADLKHQVHEKKSSLSVGMELQALQGFFLRAGYLASREGASGSGAATGGLGGLSRLGAGFGLKLGDVLMDYSFVPMGEIGSAQRLSLGFRF